MDYEIARPEDVHVDRDRAVAIGFLARYRQPTRGLYEINLKQWFQWCEKRNLRPLNATRAHIEVWARELEELQGLMVSTVANKLTAVCGYYRFAEIDKFIDENPAEWIRRPKVPRLSTTQGMTRSELLRVLDAAQAARRKQDHALLCILGFNGLRIGEVVALDVESIGRTGGYRTIKVKREKGNRDAEIPMAPRTSWAVEECIGSRETGPLFRMRHGERMDRKAAGRVVARYVKAAGLAKRITPHSFRHTHITMGLNAGVSLRDLQNSLGYADARQLAYYDRDRDSLARNATHMVAAFVEGA